MLQFLFFQVSQLNNAKALDCYIGVGTFVSSTCSDADAVGCSVTSFLQIIQCIFYLKFEIKKKENDFESG